ncbi:MAG: GAF and ANTAR domain-containing protein [Nocardioidaceae bacterium]
MAYIAATDVDGAALSLVSSVVKREPIFGSDDTAVTVERLQFTLGEGPCVDASSAGSPVLIPDLEESVAATRWPAFRAEVIEAGVRAMFAFPVRIGAIELGVVDMYRRRPGGLSPGDLAAALSVVDAVALTLLDTDGIGDVDGLSHFVVHRAAGMVMAQLDCGIEEALVRLRARAYSEAVPIHELAADVVRGTRRFEEDLW